MFQSLEVFRIAHAMAVHAGRRQAIISENIANADTPGYLSRDLPSFQDSIGRGVDGAQKATRDRHMHGSSPGSMSAEPKIFREHLSLDGNSVSLESEMMNAVEAKRQHDRALAIYKSSLDVLRRTISSQ